MAPKPTLTGPSLPPSRQEKAAIALKSLKQSSKAVTDKITDLSKAEEENIILHAEHMNVQGNYYYVMWSQQMNNDVGTKVKEAKDKLDKIIEELKNSNLKIGKAKALLEKAKVNYLSNLSYYIIYDNDNKLEGHSDSNKKHTSEALKDNNHNINKHTSDVIHQAIAGLTGYK